MASSTRNSPSRPNSAVPASLPIVCPGHIRPVVGLRFCSTSDNLNLLLTSSHDKTAQVRWGNDGAWIGSFVGHQGAVWSSALDREGLKAVTGSADFSAKVWDASSGQLLHTFPHQHVVKAVDFSFDSKSFLSAGFEKKSFVFDLTTQTQVSSFQHPCQISRAIWISPNEFFTGGADGTLRKWDTRVAETVQSCSLQNGGKAGVTDIELGSQGIVACCGRQVSVFTHHADITQAQDKVQVKFDLESASRSGNSLLCGGMDIHVVNIETKEETAVFRGHHGPVFTCRFDRTNPGSFASGSGDGTIRIWKMVG